ncbi:MAG: hypothetical protein PF444_01080, partial [Bacteroidales bacterium]|nr:hypothetical protein [Bacteroidales bacterium]
MFFAYLGMLPLHATDSRFTEDYYTKFRNLTSRDGLSHNRILDIKQDRYGFIWIATAHGLNRYDGHSFKSFVHDSNDSTSIPGNYVTSIGFDLNGKMWVGTKTGLASYNIASESFTRFCIHSKEKIGISDPYVRCLLADSIQALLWVETVDGTLNRIDLKTFEVKHYKHRRVMAPTYDYHELFQDLDAEIWLGGRDFGPLKFNKRQLTFEALPVDAKDAQKKRDSDMASIFQDVDKLYWIGATDGFYQYFPHNNTFQKHLGTSTFDIIEDDGFNLWLGTGDGLMQYHKYNDEFIIYRHNANNKESLIHNHVNVIFKDRNENLWIGTAKGLSVLYKKKSLFTHYRHIPEMASTMPQDDVQTFLELDNGKVWIGTNQGGVIEWDREVNSFETIKGTEGERISTMYQDKKGDIWLGMWSGKGFLKCDKSKKISHYALDHTSLKRDWYNDFYEDDKGRFWMAIWGAWGVHFFDRDKGEFEDYTLRLPESPARTYIDKVAVQNDYIWTQWRQDICHRYHPLEQQYEGWGIHDTSKLVLAEWRDHHHYHYDENMGFNSVNAIVESPQKELSYWCTNDGLYVFDDGFHRLSFSESFSECYHVAFSRDNQLYICTEKGVLLANTKSLEAQFIVVNDSCVFTKIFDLGNPYLGVISEEKTFVYNSKEDSLLSNDLDTSELEIFSSTNDVLISDSVYLATDKGLVVMNSNLKSYSLYNMSNSFEKGLLSEKINGIIKQSKDRYWLATAKGLFLYHSKSGKFSVIEETLDIPVNDISRKGDTLWLATLQGLAYYTPEKQAYGVVSNMTKHQLSSHLISFIEEDNSENIWVGTTNSGVNILDKENYNIHQFLPDENSPKAFWGDDASDFAINKLGIIFISSNQGINVYHPSDSTFSHITTQNGLPSDDVLGIEFDNDGFLWILTSEALAVYDHDQQKTRIFNSEWGLTPYLFSGDITLVDNEMLIPTDKGFYRFYPQELRAQEFHNSPGFTGVKVFANDKKSDLLEHGQIILNYDENFFTINFSDFDFSETASIFYYKLEGIDPDWVKT